MNLVIKKHLNADTVLNILKTSLELARSKKLNIITATVVDASGNILGTLKDDHANALTIDIAFKKAYTASNVGAKTTEIASWLQQTTTLNALTSAKNFMALGGGVPIVIKGELVGGLGISGASTEKEDEDIALETLKKLNLV
jgi:uncharacterized protein GlcG (DUF336 family)